MGSTPIILVLNQMTQNLVSVRSQREMLLYVTRDDNIDEKMLNPPHLKKSRAAEFYLFCR